MKKTLILIIALLTPACLNVTNGIPESPKKCNSKCYQWRSKDRCKQLPEKKKKLKKKTAKKKKAWHDLWGKTPSIWDFPKPKKRQKQKKEIKKSRLSKPI